jgi:FkbM family methyltransferase
VLPIKLDFDGWLRELPACFSSGFALLKGRPAAGGQLSTIEFKFDKPITGDIHIDLVIQCDDVNRHRWLKSEINGVDKGFTMLGAGGPRELHFETALQDSSSLTLKFYHGIYTPTDPAATEPVRPTPPIGYALSICSLSVGAMTAEVPQSLVPGATRMEGALVSFQARGETLNFFVHDKHDSIQAHHSAGHLYEEEELELIAQHIKPGARILDIGANIGNHTVWFEKCAQASRVVPIEPQPRIVKHLKLNCFLNNLSKVDFAYLGVALGSADASGTIAIEQAFNPAGAVIVLDPSGTIPVRHGDALFSGQRFDFVKIDTEGAELNVIEGLRNMILRARPTMFVEVASENYAGFVELMNDLKYDTVAEYRRYEMSSNFLVKPRPLALSDKWNHLRDELRQRVRRTARKLRQKSAMVRSSGRPTLS